MGITFFFFFLIIAFILGKRIGHYIKNKSNLLMFKKKKKDRSDSISPDANWID